MLSFKAIIIVVALTIGATAIGGAYIYYTTTQQTIRTLTENSVKLESALEKNQKAIENMESQIQERDLRLSQLYIEFDAAQRRNRALQDRLGEHDIGALAAARPESIQRIITTASNRVGRCIEILSGSPLTEEEINATRRSQINTECPDIANPNYVPD